MHIIIENNVFLTTDHAASSYGIPILAINGEAYGLEDKLPILDPDNPFEELSRPTANEYLRVFIYKNYRNLSKEEILAIGEFAKVDVSNYLYKNGFIDNPYSA